jgi:hypothetical protein
VTETCISMLLGILAIFHFNFSMLSIKIHCIDTPHFFLPTRRVIRVAYQWEDFRRLFALSLPMFGDKRAHEAGCMNWLTYHPHPTLVLTLPSHRKYTEIASMPCFQLCLLHTCNTCAHDLLIFNHVNASTLSPVCFIHIQLVLLHCV